MKFNPNVSASYILGVTEDHPEKLFSSPDALKDEYRTLIKIWHPDSHPNKDEANSVVVHLNILYKRAQEKADSGSWESYGQIILIDTDGKKWKVPYKNRKKFEFGTLYYGPLVLAYVIDHAHSKFFENAKSMIDGLKFASDRMKDEMERFLPKIKKTFKTNDGKLVLVMSKTDDVFMLSDVVKAIGGKVDPKHVAWMINRLHNIACYLEYAGISHNSINADTCFISPKHHSMILFGGWWYSTKVGDSVSFVPEANYDAVPSDILRTKVADTRIDRTSIRMLGRQLLGDRSGFNLINDGVPKPLVDYLRHPVGKSAVADFTNFQDVLEASFGPKRFIKLEINPEAIYA